MTASELYVGLKFQGELSQYGHYFYYEITDIKTTKKGWIRAYVTRKFRHNDGNVTVQHNVPYTNGAKAPNTISVLDSNIIYSEVTFNKQVYTYDRPVGTLTPETVWTISVTTKVRQRDKIDGKPYTIHIVEGTPRLICDGKLYNLILKK